VNTAAIMLSGVSISPIINKVSLLSQRGEVFVLFTSPRPNAAHRVSYPVNGGKSV